MREIYRGFGWNVERMLSGLFGYSLVFEFFVLYFTWHFWLGRLSREWVVLVLSGVAAIFLYF